MMMQKLTRRASMWGALAAAGLLLGLAVPSPAQNQGPPPPGQGPPPPHMVADPSESAVFSLVRQADATSQPVTVSSI
ncbi:MAG: hypothetical protein M3Y28_07110 [Armatimonadota bacterium]|nr:hypothetical protein [Armatimonadota bacterium]